MQNNPLLKVSDLPNHAPHFDLIREEHYLPAAESAIEEARANISAVKNSGAEADFGNTIVALETSDETLSDVLSVFYNQLSAAGTDGLHKLARRIGPMSAAFSSEVMQDEDLFARIKSVYDKGEGLDLTTEQAKLLEETYKGFVRGGALLGPEDKERMRGLDERLAVLGPEFMNNTTKAMEAFELVIGDESELAGLPDNTVDAARHAADEKGYEGKWLLTLDMPVYIPVMQFADRREVREKLWRAFAGRAWKDEFDNSGNAKEIAGLRYERARLLGYESHAAYVLEKRMAETPETVWTFLDRLKKAYLPGAREDLEQLKKFARENGGPEELKPWDVSYYAEKLKQELFEFSSEDLRPYFRLDNVLNGAFAHFSRLFGVSFHKNDKYPVWHEDVTAYDLYEDGSGDFLGTLYADFHPRKGKKDGAWKTSYRAQGLYRGLIERPVVSICCDFPKPTPSRPSLLSHNDVTTLFHEMGHAMHDLLAKSTTYQSLSGTSVLWDFVELPSQIQENWTYEKETLDGFASHYKTGEKIPAELIEKLNRAKNFMAAWIGQKQVNAGTIDMRWHDRDPSDINDVGNFEDNLLKKTTFFPRMEGPLSTSFTHIFTGAYSAGYYGYKWAEVLDADAFELFKERGLYDRATADRYKKEILEKGGTVHPAELYRNFRGRDADPDALFRREGIVDESG